MISSEMGYFCTKGVEDEIEDLLKKLRKGWKSSFSRSISRLLSCNEVQNFFADA